MIFLFTDFGLEGPYVGQVKSVLWRTAPGVPVFDLLADAPACRPKEAAYLLAALVQECPPESLFLAVVDPGVGGERPPVALRLDERWFVGPGNGLFEIVSRRARLRESFLIDFQPTRLSASFHGRDLFAPVAGMLAAGQAPASIGLGPGTEARHSEWPDDLPAVIYRDRYGNLLTGLRAEGVEQEHALRINGHAVGWAPTFSAVAPGKAFWYGNSSGLVEIAVNCGDAAAVLGAEIGSEVEFI